MKFKTYRLFSILLLLTFFACQKDKLQADLIVANANIYTVDDNFSKAESFAVKDGKILAVGSSSKINETYKAIDTLNANGKTIVPGFIDAHCHFLGLGFNQQAVDLFGTKSFEDVVKRVLDFQNEKHKDFILGRGWDQNDWEDKQYPNKNLLDKLFPNTPIALTRIDGHAILANQAALDLGKVTKNSKIDGGEVVLENGELTGVLIDNAEQLVMDYWPKPTKIEEAKALLEAQKICFDLGLTTVDDAGLNKESIQIIENLQASGKLKMRIYAMVSYSEENLDYFLNKGITKTDRLNVRSFKFYADGALGSRGAMLKEPYSDKPEHLGLMVTDLETLKKSAERIANSEFQMNTHAIGDSANRAVLETYNKVLKGKKDRRWRVEHAQIVSDEDFELYKNVMPSIQPTHATSDMYWAEDRVGEERIKGAYAYKQLLEAYGMVALGTDFPVERVSPFLTFYAAVARQDLEHYPEGGFQMENALSREEALRGMTIWAAFSNFEENDKGSIEVGKYADFIILDKDIMTVEAKEIPNIKVLNTVVGGEVQ
ncbi:amidohydrolase [Winogradskyella endarachnes]|uniref:Amidohydrolase family protein n=1 Tax=Winogradskyella endarachnes TaxID=2681965 RepID=A0A6L6UFA6_9FLAO|nr:amidohydrolase [Winogradskyella endarachnes]MUU79642.1 amidohydrolase family protein [Winogradskyella endarachnes]